MLPAEAADPAGALAGRAEARDGDRLREECDRLQEENSALRGPADADRNRVGWPEEEVRFLSRR